MRHLFLTLFLLAISLPVFAQTQKQVRITTAMDGVTVAIYNAEGEAVNIGKTPYLVTLDVDRDYFYRTRHSECHPDSGYLRIDTIMAELEVPVRPYQVKVNWKVTPTDADYRFDRLRGKAAPLMGETSGQTVINATGYRLTIKRNDYRRFRQNFHFSSDTVVTISQDLQYCPKRLIVALNAGLGTDQCLPLGLTVAYGGVHGIYGRYMQTWFNRADGDDFDTNNLITALVNPYSSPAAEYLSFVAGYQYLTPMGLYLQAGVGYGSQHFNWLSADDDQRHRFAPDSSSGVVLDLGIGYLFGRYYTGAAIQTLSGGQPSFSPACAMINLGICL